MTASAAEEIGVRLVNWYRQVRRSFPWRDRKDPYAVWVSEVMLQQTTTAAVRERYSDFLRRFPDFSALERASEDEILHEVQGLGYYRRFRSMKTTAATVMKHFDGRLPDDPEVLATLPGFGAYTVGAVASIAFGLPVPAVDGNVARVMTRLFAIEGEIHRASVRRQITELTRRLMNKVNPGDLTQALFELGATVCVPRQPKCPECVLRDNCRALQDSRVQEFPQVAARSERVKCRVAVAAFRRGSEFYFQRRPPDAPRMPGFWELPEFWLDGENDSPEKWLRGTFGPHVQVGRCLARAKHSVTHHDLRLELFHVEPCPLNGVWLNVEDALNGDRPITTITRKLLEVLLRAEENRDDSRVHSIHKR